MAVYLARGKKERRDYETKLRDRCRVTGEDYDAVVEQIKVSLDGDLLDVFCELQLNVATVDVTEGMLIAEIGHIVGSVKNKAFPDIKEHFKRELKMDLAESDQELKQTIRYTHAAAERVPKVLFRLVVEKTTELEKQYIRLKTQKREAPGREEKPKVKQPFKQKDKQIRPAEHAKIKPNRKDNKN
ncbi:hypothetical protein PInf_011001 [Phytophthora infestans]|nr:hypothetical protein PInf_011001 [Phytophthora infestans]